MDSSEATIGSTPTSAEPSESRFLALPAELRNDIYEYVLQDPQNTHITGRRNFPSRALLQLSRQIREEAGSLFYGGRTFYFIDYMHLVVSIRCTSTQGLCHEHQPPPHGHCC
jgi:hypothetical protein